MSTFTVDLITGNPLLLSNNMSITGGTDSGSGTTLNGNGFVKANGTELSYIPKFDIVDSSITVGDGLTKSVISGYDFSSLTITGSGIFDGTYTRNDTNNHYFNGSYVAVDELNGRNYVAYELSNIYTLIFDTRIFSFRVFQSPLLSISSSTSFYSPTTQNYGTFDGSNNKISPNIGSQGSWTISYPNNGNKLVKIELNTPIPISLGGTGEITQMDALNALLPTQTNNELGILSTDGINSTWSKLNGVDEINISSNLGNFDTILITGAGTYNGTYNIVKTTGTTQPMYINNSNITTYGLNSGNSYYGWLRTDSLFSIIFINGVTPNQYVITTTNKTVNGNSSLYSYISLDNNIGFEDNGSYYPLFGNRGGSLNLNYSHQYEISFSGTTADKISETSEKIWFTPSGKTKLDGIQSGAEVNINADWNAISGDSQILNKPTIDQTIISGSTNAVSGGAVKTQIDLKVDKVANSGLITDTEKATLHTHSNKANLDLINQNLAISGSPEFSDVNITSIATDTWFNNIVKSTLSYVSNGLNYFKQVLIDTSLKGIPASERSKWIANYNATTRIFTITLTANSYYYVGGRKFILVAGVYDWVAWGTTNGTYFFYFDINGNRVTSAVNVPWDIETTAQVANGIYNSNNNGLGPDLFLCDEMHPTGMSASTHKNRHTIEGTRFISGGAISGEIIQTDTVAGVTWGMDVAKFVDENIYLNSSVQTESNYLIGWFDTSNDFHWKTQTDLPYLYGANRIQYDPVGSIPTEVPNTNNQYINYYTVLVNAYDLTKRVLIIPGQNIYTSVATAQSDGMASMNLSYLPFQEFNFLYQRTYRINPTGAGAYSVLTKRARLEVLPVKLGLSSANLIGTNSLHSSLSGRSDINSHPATAISNIPSGNIQSIDVQSAINELDIEKESILGNPTIDGQVLSSTTGGTRSWITSSSGNILSGTSVLNFGSEQDEAKNTITSLLITNTNIKGILFIPTETPETSLDDFKLNGVSFNIENIKDNISFDIRGTAINGASGNYTINYKQTY